VVVVAVVDGGVGWLWVWRGLGGGYCGAYLILNLCQSLGVLLVGGAGDASAGLRLYLLAARVNACLALSDERLHSPVCHRPGVRGGDRGIHSDKHEERRAVAAQKYRSSRSTADTRTLMESLSIHPLSKAYDI
jgi:hypothetical protein